VEDGVDATRRTRLANERTYLAWWRTGLTALAVSIGAGKLVPTLSGGAAWPYQVVGVGFAIAGLALIAYGYVREKQVTEALDRNEFAGFDNRPALLFAVLGVLLGAGTILVVIVHPG
jgi:inner membrane protein YidH